jgi:hypothetical protein
MSLTLPLSSTIAAHEFVVPRSIPMMGSLCIARPLQGRGPRPEGARRRRLSAER